jgi:hypothetical protein
MTVWSGTVSRAVESSTEQSASGTFQNVGDAPIDVNITLNAHPEMYESVSTSVYFNISLVILGSSPMNMTIRGIEFLFSPLDLETRLEADLPRTVGSYGLTFQIANATRMNIEGSVQITPVIISGEVFLGCGVDYIISNSTSSGTCEWGDNCWFAIDGSLFMIPVVVYPSILRLEGWSCGLAGSLLICGLVALYEFWKRWFR